MKTFSIAPDSLRKRVQGLIMDQYPDLKKHAVTFDLLFVEDSNPLRAALTVRGSAAYACVRITNRRERVKGAREFEIVVDKKTFEAQSTETQNAILAHELQHVAPKRDKENNVKVDDEGRPKLGLLRHTVEFGWFDTIAKRYGTASIEVQQAKSIVQKTGDTFFPKDES